MYGQNVAIAVVAKSKLSISEKEIQEWMGERLAKFKMPKEIYLVEEIPKTATGKIQRRLVAEEILRQRKITAKL